MILGSSLLLLILSAAGAFVFIGTTSEVNRESPGKCDAVYVLAGDFQSRNPEAARLYHEGVVPRVIVYNDALFSSWSLQQNRNLYQVEWAEEDLIKRGVPRSALVRLPFAGNGTRYEALSLRRYLQSRKMNRIVLITSDVHAGRALATFRRVVGPATDFVTDSVDSGLKMPQALSAYLTETVKTVYYGWWLHVPFRFMSPEEIDGTSPGSRTSLPLSLFRRSAPLVVKTADLAEASYGIPYRAALAAGGGVGPYSWTLDEGTLPSGLVMTGRGVISGTPLLAGEFTLPVTVTDGAGFQLRKRYRLTVAIAALAVTKTTLPEGRVGMRYGAPLTAKGGVRPYAWSLAAGSLPPGFVLTPSGYLTGTPLVAGSFMLSVRARDAGGTTADQNLALRVTVPP